jgi:hypothetical protein
MNAVNFNGLDADSSYLITIEATYDLNDGLGDSTETLTTLNFKTQAYSPPSGVIVVDEFTYNGFDLTIDLSDEDSVLTSTPSVQVYQDTTLVDTQTISVGSNVVNVIGLLPNTEYEIRLVTSYDLLDGNGVQTDETIFNLYQFTTAIDVVTITNETLDTISNTLDVEIDDPDGIITSASLTATLIQGSTEVDTFMVSVDTPTTIDITNLLSDFDYELEIEGTYLTGAGTVTDVIHTHSFTTDELYLPTVEIAAVDTWTSSPDLTFDLTVGADTDNVASDTGWTAYLYQDGSVVDSIDIDSNYGNPENTTVTITFSGYDHTDGSTYTVLITSVADLNDVEGQGAVETDVDSRTFIDMNN